MKRQRNPMGKALKDGYRNKVFLMTKSTPYRQERRIQQLEESCEGCKPRPFDRCNSWSIRMNRPGKIFPSRRFDEAVLGRKKPGKSLHRFHRHKSRISLKMLQTAQEITSFFIRCKMPLNVWITTMTASEKKVASSSEKNIGFWPWNDGGRGQFKSNTVTPRKCLHYDWACRWAWSSPFSDHGNPKETIESARCYTPMTERCARYWAKNRPGLPARQNRTL